MKKLLTLFLAATLSTAASAQTIDRGPGGPYSTASRGQLPGTTTNDNAVAGNIGEYIQSVISQAAAISLTSVTATNITSITLTAGDWDINGTIDVATNGTTKIISIDASISNTSATIDVSPDRRSFLTYGSSTGLVPGATVLVVPINTTRVSIATSTTFYLVTTGQFNSGTLSGFGFIRARRVR